MSEPHLIWDCGTAYDLFMSLSALHAPSKYDIRGAWARGVRARLSAGQREILEHGTKIVWPMGWVHRLPAPKDSATALQALRQTPVKERLRALVFSPEIPAQVWEIWQDVAARGCWDQDDHDALMAVAKRYDTKKEVVAHSLEWWSRAEEFGERYLDALEGYFEAFFAEEEKRIGPALEAALAQAQELARKVELSTLLEELSQGLRLTELPQVAELVLAPSFWSTPLLVFARVSDERDLILFGARPPDASLVPGEVVPDAVMRALKALSDPTRLRILRYLIAEPLSPSQIARRLRLRAPTVIHHLDKLRMAGLVHLTLGKEQDIRRYAARPEAIRMALSGLETFLTQEKEH